jgi:hypothetical protein
VLKTGYARRNRPGHPHTQRVSGASALAAPQPPIPAPEATYARIAGGPPRNTGDPATARTQIVFWPVCRCPGQGGRPNSRRGVYRDRIRCALVTDDKIGLLMYGCKCNASAFRPI